MTPKKFNTIVQNFKYNVKLTGVTRSYFIKCEWDNADPVDMVSWQYLLYRALFFLYFFVCLIINICLTKHPNYYVIMATNWSFLVQLLYGLTYFSNLTYRFIQHRRYLILRKNQDVEVANRSRYVRTPTQLNILDSLSWLLLNIAGALPYIVSLGYWILIYDSNYTSTSASDIMLNLTSHGFNAILAFIDTFVVAIPIRMAHALYTMILTFLYLVFSLIYEYGGGTYPSDDPERQYIYKFLDWRNNTGMTIVYCLLALLGAFLLHVVLWLLYRVRMHIVPRLRGPSAYTVST